MPKTTSTPIPSGSFALVTKPPPGVVSSSISEKSSDSLNFFKSSIEAAINAAERNFLSPLMHFSIKGCGPSPLIRRVSSDFSTVCIPK